MTLLRVIVWVIFIYLAAKLIGVMIRYVRRMMMPHHDSIKQRPKDKEQYPDVEDVPYEDIPDKK
jgi:hypothetical protein